MPKNFNRIWLVPIGLLALVGLYFLPPVNARLAPRVDDVRTRLVYFFNPPDEAVFQPSGSDGFENVLATTRAEYALTITPEAQSTSTPPPGPTIPPTRTATPLPATVKLDGVIYVDQCNRWNYCGPANLAMALNFWGWAGNRDDIAKVIKPGDGDPKLDFIQQGFPDKNVMPYEMVDYVNQDTEYRALQRYGGDMGLVKRLVVAGFPVVIEKGYYERDSTGKVSWLGHYAFVTGYDDTKNVFIWQDSYPPPQPCQGVGRDVDVSYTDFIKGWRAFNYLFLVIYPSAREAEVLDLLGPWSDASWAARHALETAETEIESLAGIDLYYAWFAKGTSHVALQQYVDAAIAYDQAFIQYGNLPNDGNRPYRMMWYQTGPYFAYYYSMRYQDVIDLADITLTQTISKPTLEESLLWRGRAYYMIGDTQGAIDDYRAALKIHANWGPAVQALQDLGLQP